MHYMGLKSAASVGSVYFEFLHALTVHSATVIAADQLMSLDMPSNDCRSGNRDLKSTSLYNNPFHHE